MLNQYYWPGVEATANLLTDLCEGLAADYDVTVVTGRLRGIETPDARSGNGVRIVRVRVDGVRPGFDLAPRASTTSATSACSRSGRSASSARTSSCA